MPVGVQGDTVTLSAILEHADGSPADDPELTLTVLDSGEVPVAGFPVAAPPIVHDDLGAYHFVWTVPDDLVIGDYTATWSATVDGADAGGSEQVEIVPPGSVGTSLLTVAEFRAFKKTKLSDAALTTLLAAAASAIEERAGPLGTIVDIRVGGLGTVSLSRRAGAITEVREQWLLRTSAADLTDAVFAAEFWLAATVLDPDDYLVAADGYSLQRLATGPNPAETWGQAVQLTYTAADDTAERKRVQLELVKLDLASTPGVVSQRIGDFSETFESRAALSYAQAREDILGSLSRKRWRFG